MISLPRGILPSTSMIIDTNVQDLFCLMFLTSGATTWYCSRQSAHVGIGKLRGEMDGKLDIRSLKVFC